MNNKFYVLAKPLSFSGFTPGCTLVLSYCYPDLPGGFNFCEPDIYPPVVFDDEADALYFIMISAGHYFYHHIFLG